MSEHTLQFLKVVLQLVGLFTVLAAIRYGIKRRQPKE
jgi:hypothetical protein